MVGMKSYGRAPTFLLATGYEQVRSVAAALAGDREAADTVQLQLPETGVCSSDIGTSCDVPAAVPAGFAAEVLRWLLRSARTGPRRVPHRSGPWPLRRKQLIRTFLP